MTNKQLMKLGPTCLQVIIGLLMTGFTLTSWADLQLPILKSGTVTYSNVTVFKQTEQEIHISHSQGLVNIKISTLDDAALRALGLKEEEKPSASGTILAQARGVTETVDQLKSSLSGTNRMSFSEMVAKLKETSGVEITPAIMQGTLAGVVVLYLFFCYCLKLICRNAGARPGLLIWLPILQMFPLLRAAKMSGWCFLLFLIPLVNFFAQIWWSFRIAKACGKGALTGFLLILPGINLLAFLYLAFSKGQSEESDPVQPVRFEGMSNA